MSDVVIFLEIKNLSTSSHFFLIIIITKEK
jgi:hypothetical protein